MPLSGTYFLGRNNKPTYPAIDSHSEILPYDQREHAFNEEQYTNSSEKSWSESTPNGMPLSDTYGFFHRRSPQPTYPAFDSHSTIEPYNQRDHAYNVDQFHNSSEKTWLESTPSGMPLADTYGFMSRKAQPTYPAKDSHSEILPYN